MDSSLNREVQCNLEVTSFITFSSKTHDFMFIICASQTPS